MRIHSDTLSQKDILDLLLTNSAYLGKISKHGSRKRDHAFEVNLAGSGKTSGQWGQTDGKAATWDEWGMFLSALYTADPEAVTPYYADAEDFHWQTGGRFHDLTPSEQHLQHRWEWIEGYTDHDGRVTVHQCKGSKNHYCEALTRRHY